MLHNSILDVIGHTPIVRLAQFSEDLGIEVYAKLESLNPGGSHKARIALGMILDAERRGVLIRDSGQTIIEPSGGNTGIGLVMAGNVLGYKVVLVTTTAPKNRSCCACTAPRWCSPTAASATTPTAKNAWSCSWKTPAT
jgi:cysteine synthase